MAQFIIAYFGGERPATPEAGQAHMAKYKKWLGGLGKAAVVPMAPMGQSHFVTKSGVTTDCDRDKLSGYSVVEAESLEAALNMAKTCPFADIGGTMEVAELIKMG